MLFLNCNLYILTIGANELQDVTAYDLRSDILSPETMPKANVEFALTKNRKLLLACMLAHVNYLQLMFLKLIFDISISFFESFFIVQSLFESTIEIMPIDLEIIIFSNLFLVV